MHARAHTSFPFQTPTTRFSFFLANISIVKNAQLKLKCENPKMFSRKFSKKMLCKSAFFQLFFFSRTNCIVGMAHKKRKARKVEVVEIEDGGGVVVHAWRVRWECDRGEREMR